MDVEEQDDTLATSPVVLWEYWNGKEWTLLQFRDGSENLRVRGYLYFTAPKDHCLSTEFGRNAFWIRVRPHDQRPVAAAGPTQEITIGTDDATQGTFLLDASASRVFDRQEIARYKWELVSSNPPVADAGADIEVDIPCDQVKANVCLDASGSDAEGREPLRYFWRNVTTEEKTAEPTTAMPRLRTIRTNTVTALSVETMQEEVLGSSDGKPHQSFRLARRPIHGEAQIAVREVDRPPKEELAALEGELRGVDANAQAILTPPGTSAAEGVWIRWHHVADFADSSSVSRHYILDPVNGVLAFGDGKRGMIPPVGRDNIRAVLYRTLDSVARQCRSRRDYHAAQPGR